MMRSVSHWSVAIRKPDGQIRLIDHLVSPWAAGRRWLRMPIIRGVVALGESLVIGLKALAISAREASDDDGDDPALSRSSIGLTLALSLAITIGLFLLLPLFLTSLLDLESGVGFWAVEGVIRLAILLAYLSLMALIPDLRRVFQYHAAEHMAIHAHEAESAARFPQLHVRCGTAFLLIVMVISIFVFALVGTPAFHWLVISRIVGIPVIAGLAYEVIRWAGRNQARPLVVRSMTPRRWLQHLTTRRAEIEHLEVSCEALRHVLALEQVPPEWANEVEVMA